MLGQDTLGQDILGQDAAGFGVAALGCDAGPGDFVSLLKPRVMSLVVLTALAGMLCAPDPVNPVIGFASLMAIAVGAGAAGALNMWWDADIDALMARTRLRAVPAGRIAPAEALCFGVILAFFAVLTLAAAANFLAAGLLAFTIFFYVAIYTMWLKRSTPQNIVIGGAAGALPPVVGYAAVSGSVTLDSLLLFAIIFLWTPPHFWALALMTNTDYGKANIPMLPNVRGVERAKKEIFAYSVVLVAASLALTPLGVMGRWYFVAAAILGAIFLFDAWKMFRGPVKPAARVLFKYSLLYLALMCAAMVVDRVIG